MRAVKLTGGDLRVVDVPIPEIGPDEVLVKVAGAGLCHSDLHVARMPGMGFSDLLLGHETAGTVETIGTAVDGFAAGDPVLVYLVWSCGVCRACVQGRDNVCMAAGRKGMPPCPGLGPDGGMAEYIKVKARYLEPIGGLDPVTAGPLADAGLTPMHAIYGARHRLLPGSTAVVIGIGGLGHMAVQLLKVMTSACVVAIDSDPEKLDVARACHADHLVTAGDSAASAVLELTDGYGADAIFDTVGNQATVELSQACIAPDGALRVSGIGGGSIAFPPNLEAPDGLPWGVDLRASYGGTRQDQRMVIDLARRGLITVETQMYALDDGPSAFDDLEAGRVRGRAILVP